MTTNLTPWDWRYRVGFDDRLYRSVECSIGGMPSGPERRQLTTIAAFFRDRVSVDALLSAARDHPNVVGRWLEAAQTGSLLPLPDPLGDRAHQKLSELALPESTHAAVADLIDAARGAPDAGDHRPLWKIVFGRRQLESLLATAEGDYEPVLHDRTHRVAPEELADHARSVLGRLTRDPDVRDRVGRMAAPDPEIRIEEGDGWGAYWPRELTGADRDRLVLYDNPVARIAADLDLTLVHEVYPGHGAMYQRARDANPPHVDHGATAFIEGWATWCDWHALDRPAARHARNYRLALLQAFDASLDDFARHARDTARTFGYGADDGGVVRNALLHRAQYPGLEFAYTLGALAFERQLSGQRPDDFFAEIADAPWGDYFATWE